MDTKRTVFTAAMVVLAVVCLVALVGKVGTITGYAAAGGTTPLGNFSMGNPGFGAVKGNVMWVIYDVDGETIIGNDTPDEVVTVYFVPQGEEVNLSAEMECDNIGGALNNVDADDDAGACIQIKYDSPTAQECEIEVGEDEITIYKTNTSMAENNAGCFAAKIRGGEYDMYV